MGQGEKLIEHEAEAGGDPPGLGGGVENEGAGFVEGAGGAVDGIAEAAALAEFLEEAGAHGLAEDDTEETQGETA